ncbi:MAG: hypothetical protein ABJ215_14730 [Alphaproteobacteria bacterium]
MTRHNRYIRRILENMGLQAIICAAGELPKHPAGRQTDLPVGQTSLELTQGRIGVWI